jgi:AcrR family transcriptional regulator
VGRPREHDEQTAAALLDAAERAVEVDGVGALSLRRVAADAGTTTRAVYSLFGSKDGLIVALGARAYELLRTGLEQLPATADPQADLVEAGLMFRRFATGHPSLFSLGIQRNLPSSELWPEFRAAAADALAVLGRRLQRLHEDDLLGRRTVRDATIAFHALCEGLAAVELRGTLPAREAARMWREALTALVTGFAAVPAPSSGTAARRRRARGR